jgi:quercetin dioxygenase-like cupin family protein
MTRTLSTVAAIVFASAACFVPPAHAAGEVTPVRAEKLPNVPGKTLTAVVVNYAPGGKSVSHRHAGSVFAYVLSGTIRSENSATGPARVY